MKIGSLVKNLNTGSMGIVVKMHSIDMVHIDWLGSTKAQFSATVWNTNSIYLEVICE